MTRMMKKMTAVFLALILALSITPLSALAAGQAVSFELDGFCFLGDDSGLAVISCNISEAADSIDIPETVVYNGRTYTVTDIASGAFYDLDDGFLMKSVTIPASVGHIESAAFKNCQKLETVTFSPGSILTELPDRVFEDCYSLKSVNIPEGVTSIGSRAFYYCALKGITLPDGLSVIGEEAFGNTLLSSVTIPAGVENIGTKALSTCMYYDYSTYNIYRTLKTVCYEGSRSEWNTLVSGKDIGIGSAAVYTKATVTFDTMGQGTAPDPVTVAPFVTPGSIVGSEGPYVTDGEKAVEAWYEDEALTKPFDFRSLLTDDVTVYAKWGDRKYTVTVRTLSGETVAASRYKLTPSGTNMFLPGTTVTVTFPYYYFTDLSGALLDGVRLKPFLATATRFNFTMPHHDAVLTVVTESDPSYPITVQRDPVQGGNAYSAISGSAIEGERVELREWAYDGYRFKEWRATGGVTVDDDGYFTMPAEAVTVTAVFEPEYTVIWLNGDGSRLMSAVYCGDEEEPVTDLIPEKADEGSYSYTFERWDEGEVSGNTKTYTPVFSRTLKDIPLWLGDTQVTGENCADIPSVTDGKASFDPETNTLTLDNVRDIRGEYSEAILVSGLSKLTVRMTGNSRFDSFIRNSASSDYIRAKGIVTTGDLSFTEGGEGSLSLTNFEQAIVTNGGALTIGSGTVSCSMYSHVFECINDDNGVIECDEMILSGGSLSIDALCHAHGTMTEMSSHVAGGDDTYSLNGIDCRSFTMNGGSLSVRNASSAVAASASVQIEGGQVSITDIRSVGLYSPQIIICGTDTDVSVSTSSYAVYSTSSLTLSDEVAIISPEGAYTGNGKIWNPGGTMATDVRIATKEYNVNVDVGDLGENITVPVRHGSNFFDALDARDVFDTLWAMDSDDVIFRDLATKPLSEFPDAEAFRDDAEALLDMTVTSDMTVYACFYTRIRAVSLTLEQPVAGTAVTVEEEDQLPVQTPAPVITLPDDAHCSVSEGSAVWFAADSEGSSGLFSGTFAKGQTYYAGLMLTPDFGYWLDDDTVVTANGAKVEESYGRMALYVSLSAQAVSSALLGDADGDGEVSILDATRIQRYLAGFSVRIDEKAADLNGDGIDILDATFIQRFLAGLSCPDGIGEPIA